MFRFERHPLKSGLGGLGESVEVAETGVGHRPVRIEQALDWKIITQQFPEKLNRLMCHTGLQPVIIGGIKFFVGWEHPNAVKL